MPAFTCVDLADLYSAGCPPIPQNGSKVLECYIDALFYTDNPNEIYSRKLPISIYITMIYYFTMHS